LKAEVKEIKDDYNQLKWFEDEDIKKADTDTVEFKMLKRVSNMNSELTWDSKMSWLWCRFIIALWFFNQSRFKTTENCKS